jgi:hypothetical protein
LGVEGSAPSLRLIYTLAFALQLRKKHEKPPVRVVDSIISVIKRDRVINVHRTSRKVPVITVIFLLKWIFEKYSNIKFLENSSSGSQVVPSGRADMKLILVFTILRTSLKIARPIIRHGSAAYSAVSHTLHDARAGYIPLPLCEVSQI